MLHKLCGDAAFKNIVLVTNMWSEVAHDIGEAREEELSSHFLKLALDKGARMVRHNNSVESAHSIIQMIAASSPVVLQIQWELVDKQESIIDTAAGESVSQELNGQIRRHLAELGEVREEMLQALREEDEETVRELNEHRSKLEKRIEEIEKDLEGMTADYAVELERIEAGVKEMEREARRAQAEHTHELANLTRGPAITSTVDRLGLGRGKLQARSDGSGANGYWVVIPIYQ